MDKGLLFTHGLLQWNRQENNRQMPWKGEKDPYRIWLSEIILQQTRVEQGLKYYENFTKAFPKVHDLANAPEEKVFKLWEGLGYYNRCRNLITTARYISKDLKGKFPADHDSILQLKGVGTYTAAAIASFAYNLPFAVLDGNVFRVLSRIYDLETPIDTTAGKKQFGQLAQDLLPPGQAASFNQAIMDFGALICKPVPVCSACFFNQQCQAFLSGRQDLLPVKEKKLKVRDRWFNYLVLTRGKQVLIRQRNTSDIWQRLFEFTLVETDHSMKTQQVLQIFEQQYGIKYRLAGSVQYNQRLTHQVIHFQMLLLELEKKESLPGFSWVPVSKLEEYAFPKTLQQYIISQLK